MTEHTHDHQGGDESSYLFFLLLSLVFMLLVVPMFEQSFSGRALMHLGLTLVLISAAIATRRRRIALVVGMGIAIVVAPIGWLTMIVEQPLLFAFSCILESLFFVGMAGVIVASVIRRHLASIHSIFGAISAYLLLGLAWAVLYLGLEIVDPDSFSIANRQTYEHPIAGREVTVLSQLIYFSFVTMSTLGYGDMTPITAPARTLAWMQSVTGLFYVAVLVALLVSEISPRAANRRRDKPEE